MEEKKYQYRARGTGNIVEFGQGELTLKQEADLIDVFSDLELQIDSTNPLQSLRQLTLGKIVQALKKKGAILNFFKVILIFPQKISDEDLLAMPYSIQREVIADFLACNAVLINDLGNIFAGTASNVRTSAKAAASASPKSSTSFAKATSAAKVKSKK